MSTKKRAQKRIFEHLYNTRSPHKAESVQGMFNYKCFHNSIQYATENDLKVVMGIVVDNHNPILHFWCEDKDGKYLEVTLGYLAENLSYYPMRVIDEERYSMIEGIFSDAVDYWTVTFTSRFERMILNFNDERIV